MVQLDLGLALTLTLKILKPYSLDISRQFSVYPAAAAAAGGQRGRAVIPKSNPACGQADATNSAAHTDAVTATCSVA